MRVASATVTFPAYRRRTGFSADVYWREPAGRVVMLSPGNGVYMMSSVHPEGDHAVFWGGASGRPRLWAADGSGGLEALTDGRYSARYPAYNAAGTTLVYCKSSHPSETIGSLRIRRTVMPLAGVAMTIVVRSADGSWERDVTDGRHQDQRPALSPDGTQVAFISDRGGREELWTVSSSADQPVPLLPGVSAYRPWWSVDGQEIYFFTLGPGRHRLYAVPATGGRPRPLANDDRGDTHGPYADLDGSTLIAHSTRGARSGGPGRGWALYEFPLDGSAARPLGPGAHGSRARNGVMTFDARRRH